MHAVARHSGGAHRACVTRHVRAVSYERSRVIPAHAWRRCEQEFARPPAKMLMGGSHCSAPVVAAPEVSVSRLVRITGPLVLLVLLLGAAPAGAEPPPLDDGSASTTAAAQGSCPAGHQCSGVAVACPGIAPATGVLAVSPADRTTRGVVALFSGGDGTGYWSAGGAQAMAFIADLNADGLEVVQVRWTDSWMADTLIGDTGSAGLACRPATVIQHIHAERVAARGLDGGAGCGFCVSGNSGGASQIAYALSHYGMDGLIDVAVPTGGPPHADIAAGCLGSGDLRYDTAARQHFDESYGFLPGLGPCSLELPLWQGAFERDSVTGGALDLRHPDTRIELILGDRDTTVAPAHARRYVDALEAGGSRVGTTVVPGMGHRLQSHPGGLAALAAALDG